jgi:hypothetical protein
MKLYPRQLNNLDELKREKEALKANIKRIEDEGFFSIEDILPAKMLDGAEGDSMMSKLTDLVSSGSVKEVLTSIAGPALSLLGTGIEKRALKKVAKEFLGSYVKWKAIELGYKGIKMWLDSRKKEKDDKA